MNTLINKIKIGDRLLINGKFDYLKVLNIDDAYICAASESDGNTIYISKFVDDELNSYYLDHSGHAVVICCMAVNYYVKEGLHMFEIMGGYDKRMQNKYYMVAKNTGTAKKKFKAKYSPVLQLYSVRELSKEESDSIIKMDPYKVVLDF